VFWIKVLLSKNVNTLSTTAEEGIWKISICLYICDGAAGHMLGALQTLWYSLMQISC